MTDLLESRTPSTVLPVSLLVSSARLILERNLPLNWVSGEISNFTKAPSGHCYFVLKDDRAQVRCVFFRHKAQHIDFPLRDGTQVEVRALATLYEARGEFQLNVEAIRLAGAGALFEAFARLKARLQAQGWFDAARKRALPAFPACVGVVTSPRAAALRDVLSTMRRRMPSIRVIVYPCGVQGKGAGDEIAQAIRKANARHECDLLIVCRGGGSIEDLWAFNEEAMARAVLESELPVVSGVGHETDFTICDFVADVRAETPTAAATLVAPDRAELDARARSALLRVRSQALRALEQRMQRTDQLAGRLRHPAARLRERLRALRQLATRLALAWRSHHAHRVMRFEPLLARWTQRVQVEWPQREAVRHSAQLLSRAAAARMQVLAARVAQCELALAHLNPEAVLARGYSLVLRADGSIVQSSRNIALGERLQLRFAHGDARVEVREKSD